jgi:hypothetical protein
MEFLSVERRRKPMVYGKGKNFSKINIEELIREVSRNANESVHTESSIKNEAVNWRKLDAQMEDLRMLIERYNRRVIIHYVGPKNEKLSSFDGYYDGVDPELLSKKLYESLDKFKEEQGTFLIAPVVCKLRRTAKENITIYNFKLNKKQDESIFEKV